MSGLADIASPHAGSRGAAVTARPGVKADAVSTALQPLRVIDPASWRRLAACAIEANGYYLPEWELAVSASARGRTEASALAVWRDRPGDGSRHLAALLPAISLWRALRIPLPALASADPYGTLGTPMLDRACADTAADGLMRAARQAGAHALLIRDLPLDGEVMAAFTRALGRTGAKPRVLDSYARACLDASGDAETLLRDALGSKKLKELRRQRNRLADHGEVVFRAAREPEAVAAALEIFLELESSGWKGARGTALANHPGDAAFIRRAAVALAAHGQCEIMTLHAGDEPAAAAVVLRHHDQAYYFKLGINERFARLSPGVQLTLDITRHFCADPAIARVDSTANAGHPMIDPIWRGRLAVGDVLIPLRGDRDPVVALIAAAVAARRRLRGVARRLVHSLRKHREATI